MLVFWAALLLPVYSYALFPLLIVAMSAVAKWYRVFRPIGTTSSANTMLPPVAIVVSAYNEEEHIADLVSNLRSLEYPVAPTLYLGSDGSSDRTAEILEAHAEPGQIIIGSDSPAGRDDRADSRVHGCQHAARAPGTNAVGEAFR